ncbi:MAG: membrane protein insertion efficiency factor YidD [Bacillota bacterium]
MGIISRFLVLIIKFYQLAISPFFGKRCRFYPTCSQYGIQALQKYGAAKGLSLTFKRLIKCHPFNPGGYDPLI